MGIIHSCGAESTSSDVCSGCGAELLSTDVAWRRPWRAADPQPLAGAVI
jgi:hypothetical protein